VSRLIIRLGKFAGFTALLLLAAWPALAAASSGHTEPGIDFLGDAEAVFGIWAIPLFYTIAFFYDRATAVAYINEGVSFTEPVFVVVIMTFASTRPILELTERALRLVARLGGETPAAWWLVLVAVGPLLGSLITEPAAMTICASILSSKFYAHKPSKPLAYGTLGLLFVAISVGGTWTSFAAPPVLMVADAWGWTTGHMMSHFGWKAALGTGLTTAAYYLFFRHELHRMRDDPPATKREGGDDLPIPFWSASFWQGSSFTGGFSNGGSPRCWGAWTRFNWRLALLCSLRSMTTPPSPTCAPWCQRWRTA
jgi:hypothetical protein